VYSFNVKVVRIQFKFQLYKNHRKYVEKGELMLHI